MRRLASVLAIAMIALLAPTLNAHAVGALSASVSIPTVTYNGAGCVNVPVTLHLSGGVSNGFAYWTTENETLSGPTSWPSPPSFFIENEEAPGINSMTICPSSDHAGVYTYSADVWYHNWSDEGGDQFVGRVTAEFTLGLAATTIVRIGKHKWQVRIIGQPYLVSYPSMALQKKTGKWRTISRGQGNSAGKFVLLKRAPGKYRLIYKGNADNGLSRSTSTVFRRP